MNRLVTQIVYAKEHGRATTYEAAFAMCGLEVPFEVAYRVLLK